MSLPGLYAVVDYRTATQHGWRVCDLARAYLAGGARLLQIRATDAASGEYLAWCDEIIKDATDVGAQVIVNDRADIAAVAGAAGVHLGQTDLSPNMARQVVGTTMMLGLSTHTRAQLDRLATVAVDYVAVGPVYQTDTKDTGYSAVGLDLVTYAAGLRPARPVVAIGGITLDRVESLVSAGATSVAVISDLLSGNDPSRRVADYVRALEASSAK